MTPRGARVLLGLPAGELTSRVVDLDALLGSDASRLKVLARDLFRAPR